MFVGRAMGLPTSSEPQPVVSVASRLPLSERRNDLDATLFTRPAPVVRNRRAILDGLYVQTRCLERGDGTFTTTSGSFDANVDFFDAELEGFVGRLLCRTLTCKRSALAASLEATGSRTGPTQGFALGVGDGHRRVVKGCLDVCNPVRDIATYAFLFGLGHLSTLHELAAKPIVKYHR